MGEFSLDKKTLDDQLNYLVRLLISKKVSAIKPGSLKYSEEVDSLSVYENAQIQTLEKRINRVSEYPEYRGNEKLIQIKDLRNAGVRDFEVYDDMYIPVSRGLFYNGKRSARVNGQIKQLDVELFEVKLTPLIFFNIYYIKGVEFNEEKFRSQFTEKEYRKIVRLLESMLCKCMTDGEYGELFKLLSRDETMKHFFWDIKYEFDKEKNKKENYVFFDPLCSGLLDGETFKFTNQQSLFRNAIKSMLTWQYFIFSLKIKTPEKSEKDGEEIIRSQCILRSSDAFRFMLEVDKDAVETFDFNILFSQGIVLKPEVYLLTRGGKLIESEPWIRG